MEKALHWLKKAPCAWYARIDGYLLGLGFTKSEPNSNLYYVFVEGELLILVLYVDDLFLIRLEKSLSCAKRILL